MKVEARYRAIAGEHLSNAEALLLQENEQSARYACLELRLCIEALCYELLALYRNEMSKSAISHWTPKKVLSELLQIDEHATSSATISIQEPKTGEWLTFCGPNHRLSVTWANKAHNALSTALHTPTIGKVGKTIDKYDFYKGLCDKYILELQKVARCDLHSFSFIGPNFIFTCQCGFKMTRREELVCVGYNLVCSDCGRTSIVEELNNGIATIRERRIVFKCNKCDTENAVPEIDMKGPIITNCRNCSARIGIKKSWQAFYINEELYKTQGNTRTSLDPNY
ncbi:UNVERIFIED_ORG: DNA-directed RNA polymerase subunit RPC12/RpoP [Methylorubrum zatmanii]